MIACNEHEDRSCEASAWWKVSPQARHRPDNQRAQLADALTSGEKGLLWQRMEPWFVECRASPNVAAY